jgi:hypothetical protein
MQPGEVVPDLLAYLLARGRHGSRRPRVAAKTRTCFSRKGMMRPTRPALSATAAPSSPNVRRTRSRAVKSSACGAGRPRARAGNSERVRAPFFGSTSREAFGAPAGTPHSRFALEAPERGIVARCGAPRDRELTPDGRGWRVAGGLRGALVLERSF